MIENKSLGSKIFDVLNVVFLVIVMLICIMPVWYVLCVSLSSREAVNAGKVAFWPVGFNLFSYQKILGEGEFFGSFLISIKRVVLGTAVSMVCVLMAAFPLSRTKKQFPHKGIFMWILVFCMLFNGGTVPWYITMRSYHLMDNIWGQVLEQQDTLPPEKQRELLRSAEEESEWLIHMVENLLTITRLNGDGETRLITQPEAVEEIMASAAAKFRRRYPDFAVQVTAPDELLLVPMDATLMEQVLLNLLENAALHGGRVKNITLAARRRNDKAELRVEDDGVGLDSHGLESVFDGMRTRAEQTSSDRRNMGIGLTVCRTIVNAHGGQITAANRPQGGASFCITLPLAEIEEEEHDE